MRKKAWASGAASIAVLFAAVASAAGAEGDQGSAPAAFRDVPKTHWAYAPILAGAAKGYLSGMPDGSFKPGDPVTAAQFIKMTLMSLTDDEAGFPWWSDSQLALVPWWNRMRLSEGTDSFEQGKPWYEHYVNTARNLGIVLGDEFKGSYDKPITRERAARILAGLDSYFHTHVIRAYAMIAGPQLLKDFGKADGYLAEYVGDVAVLGIMNGDAAGYFHPKSFITRAEAAKICLLLADASLRAAPQVDLSAHPVSLVPLPGYDDLVFVFDSWRMKKVYDALRERQQDYPGTTDAAAGTLSYYENEDLKEKTFRKTMLIDDIGSDDVYFDWSYSASDGSFYLSAAIDKKKLGRAGPGIRLALNLIYDDPAAAKAANAEFVSAIEARRAGKAVSYQKTIGGALLRVNGYVQSVQMEIVMPK
ncbi:S-layer homology domain-containing protein [Cohnella sp. 56]|uniref:S-layer homology domain-containing protein n=1 Tax=Cohnella sp. 56 TaxID=3113722 RepID=UPI0030E84E9E